MEKIEGNGFREDQTFCSTQNSKKKKSGFKYYNREGKQLKVKFRRARNKKKLD